MLCNAYHDVSFTRSIIVRLKDMNYREIITNTLGPSDPATVRDKLRAYYFEIEDTLPELLGESLCAEILPDSLTTLAGELYSIIMNVLYRDTLYEPRLIRHPIRREYGKHYLEQDLKPILSEPQVIDLCQNYCYFGKDSYINNLVKNVLPGVYQLNVISLSITRGEMHTGLGQSIGSLTGLIVSFTILYNNLKHNAELDYEEHESITYACQTITTALDRARYSLSGDVRFSRLVELKEQLLSLFSDQRLVDRNQSVNDPALSCSIQSNSSTNSSSHSESDHDNNAAYYPDSESDYWDSRSKLPVAPSPQDQRSGLFGAFSTATMRRFSNSKLEHLYHRSQLRLSEIFSDARFFVLPATIYLNSLLNSISLPDFGYLFRQGFSCFIDSIVRNLTMPSFLQLCSFLYYHLFNIGPLISQSIYSSTTLSNLYASVFDRSLYPGRMPSHLNTYDDRRQHLRSTIVAIFTAPLLLFKSLITDLVSLCIVTIFINCALIKLLCLCVMLFCQQIDLFMARSAHNPTRPLWHKIRAFFGAADKYNSYRLYRALIDSMGELTYFIHFNIEVQLHILTNLLIRTVENLTRPFVHVFGIFSPLTASKATDVIKAHTLTDLRSLDSIDSAQLHHSMLRSWPVSLHCR
jgi:hypothetical protein